MKFIVAFLRLSFFIIILLGGILTFIYFLNSHSWWCVPVLLLTLFGGGIYQKYADAKHCPKCGDFSYTTGVGGSKYHQLYCKICKKTFWVTWFLRDYE